MIRSLILQCTCLLHCLVTVQTPLCLDAAVPPLCSLIEISASSSPRPEELGCRLAPAQGVWPKGKLKWKNATGDAHFTLGSH